MLTLNEIKINPAPADNNTDTQNQSELDSKAFRKGLEGELNTVIQDSWNLINHLNGICTTVDFDYREDNQEQLKQILESIIDDITIDIGMIYKAITLVNNETIDLIETGKEKADKLINDSDAEEIDIDTATEDSGEESTESDN